MLKQGQLPDKQKDTHHPKFPSPRKIRIMFAPLHVIQDHQEQLQYWQI